MQMPPGFKRLENATQGRRLVHGVMQRAEEHGGIDRLLQGEILHVGGEELGAFAFREERVFLRQLDRMGRNVQPDGLVTAFLEEPRQPARAAARIEHAGGWGREQQENGANFHQNRPPGGIAEGLVDGVVPTLLADGFVVA